MLMYSVLCSQRDYEACCFTATSAGMQVVTKRKLSTMLEATRGPPLFLQNLDPNTWEVRACTPAACLAGQPAPLMRSVRFVMAWLQPHPPRALQAGSPQVEQPTQGAQECAADESELLEGLLMLQDGADLPPAASRAQPLHTEEQTELAGEGNSSAACCEDQPAEQRCLLEAVAYLEADEASTEAPCNLQHDAGQRTRAAVCAP